MRKEILHERALIKVNWRDFRGKTTDRLYFTSLTDNLDMIRQMCRWLVDHHLADAPLHFSRFFPRYRLPDTPPTPLSTLRAAQRIALDEGIQHVYLGNV